MPERLAARFGITPGALLAANKEKYPAITIDFIRTGWELIIPAVPEDRTVRVKSLIGLNVREGPGTGYKKRGALSYGTEVELLASAGEWGKIDYRGQARLYRPCLHEKRLKTACPLPGGQAQTVAKRSAFIQPPSDERGTARHRFVKSDKIHY